MDQRYPLAFKVSGDLAYKMKMPDKALQFYELAIKQGGLDNSAETECLRNVGLISFTERDLMKARSFLERAVMKAVEPSQVADCHFYLAQLYEEDKDAALYHFESAAANGVSGAIAPTGFLLLNYFNRVEQAYDWFAIGSFGGDFQSTVGLFDACVRLGRLEEAKDALAKIRESPHVDSVLATRQEAVIRVEAERRQLQQGKGGSIWA
jgi:TPR repeat protein